MNKERRLELIEIYKRCSDDDLVQMIEEGPENYQDGAFELILSEAEKRGLGNEPDDEIQDNEYVYDVSDEINFDEMSTEDLMGVLVNIHALDELNFHLAAAEAIRRNIDATDVRAYKKLVRREQQCSATADTVEIKMIENPQPLVIVTTIDEASLYTDRLDEDGIPFEIQVIVDDRDYRKAEMAINNILLPQEVE